MALFDATSLCERFPEFGEQPAGVITPIIAQAERETPASVWGNGGMRIDGVAYLSAHLLASRISQIGSQVGAPSGTALGGGLDSTLYGQEYKRLRDSIAVVGFTDSYYDLYDSSTSDNTDLSLPQPLSVTDSPTFVGLTLSGQAENADSLALFGINGAITSLPLGSGLSIVGGVLVVTGGGGGGEGALQGFSYTQSIPAAVHTINHGLGYRPSVELLNAGGQEIDAEVLHPTVNQTIVTVNPPIALSARLL